MAIPGESLGVLGLLKPFGIIWMAVDGVTTLIRAIIDMHQDFKERKSFKLGEGTDVASGLAEEGGTDLPASSDNIYVQAAKRVSSGDPAQGMCTLIGTPILPVVAGRDLDDRFHECQVTQSSEHGRPLKFLLVPGKDQLSVHPIPEPIADYYLSEDYCLGAPLSDPTWSNCSKCGRLQVAQIFGGYPTGVIYTFDDDDPEPDHVHDRSSGERVGACELAKVDPLFGEPDGGLCLVK